MNISQHIVLDKNNNTHYIFITETQLKRLFVRGHLEVVNHNGRQYYKPTKYSWTYIKKDLL